MGKDEWTGVFIRHLEGLGEQASASRLASLAESSYELFGKMDPIKVAQIEFDFGPADDEDFPDTTR